MIKYKLKGFYKIKPDDKLTLTGKQLKEFAEYNRKELIKEIEKIIEEARKTSGFIGIGGWHDDLDYDNFMCFLDKLKQQLQELKENQND
jgi:hypothetical protein